RESRRLTRLINDVLDIAKMEAGRVEWHMAETDLSGVIQSAVAATSALAEEKNLPIQVTLPPEGLPPVWGDRDRLIQVMTNLLSNAIKFTDRGQIEVRGWRLTVEGETFRCTGPFPLPYEPASEIQETFTGLHFSDGEWVVVSVVDTGIGIPDEDLPRVFEKFTQVGDTLTEKPRGTGLGLSICREIIEHHGGRIWARSRLGLGSTFSFALPLEAVPPPDRVGPAAWSPSTTAQPVTAHSPLIATPALPTRKRKHTILVADDEANIRRMLRQELSEAGYRVIEAADGAEALAQARQQQPDLIVLDVMMPGVSGFDVTSALKADERTQKIPIVILSIVEDRERGLRLGADAYLTKPVDTVRLLKVVETLIATRGPE
ncbi:MAG: hybrid sensor histidine kinase/response regulator, partial [Chloroflexi bacterium]